VFWPEIQARRLSKANDFTASGRERAFRAQPARQTRHVHRPAAGRTAPRRSHGQFVALFNGRLFAASARGDGPHRPARDAQQPGDLSLAMRSLGQQPSNLGNHRRRDHLSTSLAPGTFRVPLLACKQCRTRFAAQHCLQASSGTLRAMGAQQKSPPPERTPATGSWGYLIVPGAVDTLESTIATLAQVVAQFQEEFLDTRQETLRLRVSARVPRRHILNL
jgi:hypothetical protein